MPFSVGDHGVSGNSRASKEEIQDSAGNMGLN